MDALSQRKRLDKLFVITTVALLVVGAAGFFRPTSWAVLFDDGAEVAARHIQGRLHLKETIRLFSSFMIGQAYVIWSARRVVDGGARRDMTRGLFCSTALVTVALAQAHQRATRTLSTGAHGLAFVAFFAALSLGYGWFGFCQPPAVFRGLGRDG